MQGLEGLLPQAPASCCGPLVAGPPEQQIQRGSNCAGPGSKMLGGLVPVSLEALEQLGLGLKRGHAPAAAGNAGPAGPPASCVSAESCHSLCPRVGAAWQLHQGRGLEMAWLLAQLGIWPTSVITAGVPEQTPGQKCVPQTRSLGKAIYSRP